MQLPTARCRLKPQLLQLRYGSLSQHQSLLANDNQGLCSNTHADAVHLAVPASSADAFTLTLSSACAIAETDGKQQHTMYLA